MSSQSKNRYILALCVTIAATVILGSATAYFYSRTRDGERYIETANRRSFAQLVTSMSSINSNLQKMEYVKNGPTLASVSAQIWRESEVAKLAMSSLPLADANLEKYQRFISQAGDYSFALLRASSGGEGIAAQQIEELKSLAAVSSNLTLQLSNLQARLDAEDAYIQLNPRGLTMSGSGQAAAAVTDDFSKTEEEFPEYASLVYDGPFSDHVNSLKPKMLEGKSEVSQSAAMKAAQEFLGTGKELEALHQGDGIIPYYCFSFDDSTTIEVSRQGGVVISMCNSRDLKTAAVTPDQAVERALTFLDSRGYCSMKTSYYTVFENIITINFAFVQDDIIIYPDLIKVGVALDTGDIVRFDAAGYIMNHTSRQLSQPEISRDKAWEDIPHDMEVISENTALIPTSGKNEILCHEFVCKNQDGRHVIIYINAQTGLQENVLLLIESPNGTLTI